MLFDGKTVLITGASSGIGMAVARAMAREGANVALLARRTDRLEELKKEIEDAGGKALAVEADVRDRASLDRAVAAVAEAFGGVDVVLANAGFGVGGPFHKLETEDFRRQFETNFFGMIDTIYAALPELKKSRGRLGLVGSVSGRLATPDIAPYTTSKFAVVGLAECLHYDLARFGISVTCLNPGFVASEIRSINNRGEYTLKPDYIPTWLVVPAETAARAIVRALYKRKPMATITFHGKVLVFLARYFPRLLRFVMSLTSKKQ